MFLNGLVPKSVPSVDGADCSDERAGNGKVLETSVRESTKLKPLGLLEREKVCLRWSLGSPSVENPAGHCTHRRSSVC